MTGRPRRLAKLQGQIGQRLQLLRGFLDLDQGTMAETLGIPQSSLSNYEVGRRRPSLQLLASMQDRFRVSLDWLLTGRGNWRLKVGEPADAERRRGRGPLDGDDEMLLDRIRERLEGRRGQRGPFSPVIVLPAADPRLAAQSPEASDFRAVPITSNAEAIRKSPLSPGDVEGHTIIPAEATAKAEDLRALRMPDSQYGPLFPQGAVVVLDVGAQAAPLRSLEGTVLLIAWRRPGGKEERILVRLRASEPDLGWEPIVKGGPQPDARASEDLRWQVIARAVWVSHRVG